MAAKEKGEAGPSNLSDDNIDDSLDLASKSFDPLRIIYGPSLETGHQNIEVFASVSQFMQNLDINFETEISSQVSSASDTKECVVNKSSSPMETEEACDNTTQIDPQTVDHDKCDSVIQRTILTEKESRQHEVDQNTGKQLDLSKPQSESQSESSQMNETESKPEVSNVRTKSSMVFRQRRQRPTVLTRMTTGFQEGPLSILRRSVEEKIKVRVWTRSVRNIRGISTGYVVAFDKHMNLAMMDVDEVYRRPLGKHQRKSKKPDKNVIPQAEDPNASKETEENPSASKEMEENPSASQKTEEILYPNTSWTLTGETVEKKSSSVDDTVKNSEDTDSSEEEKVDCLADGIGNLNSAFKGMYVFEETEATRLLGAKPRRLLTRHLNQVLLRGEHVVAVALVEPR